MKNEETEIIELKIKEIPTKIKESFNKLKKDILKNTIDYKIIIIILLSYICILLTGVIIVGGLKGYQIANSLQNELRGLYNKFNEIDTTEKLITIIPLFEQYLKQEIEKEELTVNETIN